MRTCAPTGRDRTLTKYTVSPGTAGAGDGEDADLLAVFLPIPAAGPGAWQLRRPQLASRLQLLAASTLSGLVLLALPSAPGREFLSGLDRHSFHWRPVSV